MCCCIHIRITFLLVLFLACAICSNAQQAKSDQHQQASDISVDNKNMPADFFEDLRDPFWTIGYMPVKITSTQNVPEAPPAVSSQFSKLIDKKAWINSRCKYGGTIERGNNRLAIINNQVVQKGDIIPIIEDGKVYKVKVVDIEAKSVKLSLLE